MSGPDDAFAAEEQAADWAFRHEIGMDADEQQRFEDWLKEPLNAATWERTQGFFEQLNDLPNPLLDAMRADALSARGSRWYDDTRRWAAAAAVVMTVGISGLVGWQIIDPGSEGSKSAGTQIASNATPTFAATDEAKIVRLPDGTTVNLQPGASVALAFSDKRRDLRLLGGAASFDVAHEGRVFAVQARDTVVTDTGTKFTVDIQPATVTTALERGGVTVSRTTDRASVDLVPGQQAVVGSAGLIQVSRVQAKAQPAAPMPDLEFEGTPLEEAAMRVTKGTSIQIKVLGAAKRLTISGRFRAGDPQNFVTAASRLLPIRVHRTGSAYELSAR